MTLDRPKRSLIVYLSCSNKRKREEHNLMYLTALKTSLLSDGHK